MPLGKLLILFGILFIAAGIAITLLPRIPWLGRLPGDIFIQKGRFTFAFPLATCLIISLLLTLLANLFFRK
jgi:hypothetical protein